MEIVMDQLQKWAHVCLTIAKYGSIYVMEKPMEKSMETSIFHGKNLGKSWSTYEKNHRIFRFSRGFPRFSAGFPSVFRWFSKGFPLVFHQFSPMGCFKPSPSGVVPVVWPLGVAGVVRWPLRSRSWKIRNIPAGWCPPVISWLRDPSKYS